VVCGVLLGETESALSNSWCVVCFWVRLSPLFLIRGVWCVLLGGTESALSNSWSAVCCWMRLSPLFLIRGLRCAVG
jgi:protein subunit release factor B